MKEKHLPYFNVIDSFSSKTCPLCFLIKKRIERYFDTLLYEGINDVKFRKQFRENQGFCNYHSFKFVGYKDGLAVAITHRDILADFIDNFSKDNELISFNKNKKGKKCIVCELIKDTESQYLSIIIEYLDEDEFKTNFLSSDGFCIPHYKLILENRKLIPDWFIKFQTNKYKEVLLKVEKYLISCSFSLGENRPKLSEEEKLIWKKVVETLFGFDGYITTQI